LPRHWQDEEEWMDPGEMAAQEAQREAEQNAENAREAEQNAEAGREAEQNAEAGREAEQNAEAGREAEEERADENAEGASAQQTIRELADQQRQQAGQYGQLLQRNVPGTTIPLDPGDIPPEESRRIIDQDGKPVTVLPGITIFGHPDGTPSRVGERFDTPEAAARAALIEADLPSFEGNVEYAGRIYRTSGGGYSFSAPATLGSNRESDPRLSPIPAGATVVGTYHTHAAGFLTSDEVFSPGDKLKATMARQESYLHTPSGQLFKYTPVDLLPKAQQGPFPQGRVTRLP